jgi:hypothetical protein
MSNEITFDYKEYTNNRAYVIDKVYKCLRRLNIIGFQKDSVPNMLDYLFSGYDADFSDSFTIKWTGNSFTIYRKKNDYNDDLGVI